MKMFSKKRVSSKAVQLHLAPLFSMDICNHVLQFYNCIPLNYMFVYNRFVVHRKTLFSSTQESNGIPPMKDTISVHNCFCFVFSCYFLKMPQYFVIVFC